MNVDSILNSLNQAEADYILIGGMNFLLQHEPELTFDVDVWVREDEVNLEKVNRALKALGAEWGKSEVEWGPVPEHWRWLLTQPVFCLTTPHGALDIFREVRGLEGRYDECKSRSVSLRTAAGILVSALSDEDMLACQEALPAGEQKLRRMEILREAIRNRKLP